MFESILWVLGSYLPSSFASLVPIANPGVSRDTVSSIGVLRGQSLPETVTGMGHVCAFRHALALDEKRVKFQPEYVNGGLGPLPGDTGNVKEVWFPGTHSDM